MNIRIAAWNVEQRLTTLTIKRRGTPEHILASIKKLNADILVLPEAYQNTPDIGVDEELRRMGYSWIDIRYDDLGREDEFSGAMPHMRVLSKLPITSSEIHRWGGIRNLPVITVQVDSETQLRIIGTHLDDRNEELRTRQVDELIPYINASTMPTVMLGDFNAMHGKGRAKLYSHKAARQMAAKVPHPEIRFALTRLSDMATGSILARLEAETPLRDIDPTRRPTTTPKMRDIEWMPSIRLAQIDHILLSPDVRALDFKIARDGGSDHRGLSATLQIGGRSGQNKQLVLQ